MNIIVVEDHDDLRDSLVELLQDKGHHTIGLSCAEDMDDKVGKVSIDLLIVDLNLPGEDGYSLTRRFRAAQPKAGIIMVTARHKLADKVQGYESGADIYLPKPVDPEELLAAVNAVARKLPSQQGQTVDEAQTSLTLHALGMKLEGPLGVEKLNDNEVVIVSALARAPGQRLEAWQLLQTLGQSMDDASKSSLEVRIVRLRKKMVQVGAEKGCISNVRNVGYQLCTPVAVY
ncbi:response regulator transcription factor [Limnohabitans sp. B9-3]|uniref:response regulator transcription factor n=1 Tax=Limnohabitans sp. B9-3 TaxID=1100707 RepID=UPI0018EA64AF|nr:response regulator transcription factor [Limnohabitans sp. B9-3]